MREWLDKSIALIGTLLLHVALIALLFSNITWQAPPQQRPATTIKATVIDAAAFELADGVLSERTVQAPPEVEPTPEPPPPEVDEAQVQRERDAALAQQREQAQREADAQAAAEQARQDAERQREAEAAAQKQREIDAEAARKREAAEAAEREAEAARKREAEAARKREEAAARKREAEAARKREAEAAARRERERQAELDAQLREAMEAEEARQGAINSGLLAQYVEVIRQKVERNWSRPPGVADGISCEIRVRQLRSGEVVSVQVVNCAGGEVLIRSIETAVRKASPLPQPRDPSLFDANLRFPFKTGE